MTQKSSPNIIWTIDRICDYLQVSRVLFYRLVRHHGLPATIIEGKWCAHTENLENYFRKGTSTPPRDISEEAE
ncbi:MAG: helix-turn-helix domain-containing protein [Deltaproteobacteria bacterium]|nr:helix-turn-helix domain-containing protein [Deltaproteobacteria bacterium]